MRYVKWSVFFEPGATEGYTPESIIRDRGGWAEGGFSIGAFDLIGYVSDGADLSNLENYKAEEITQESAFDYAKTINPDSFIDNDGKIQLPIPDMPGGN